MDGVFDVEGVLITEGLTVPRASDRGSFLLVVTKGWAEFCSTDGVWILGDLPKMEEAFPITEKVDSPKTLDGPKTLDCPKTLDSSNAVVSPRTVDWPSTESVTRRDGVDWVRFLGVFTLVMGVRLSLKGELVLATTAVAIPEDTGAVARGDSLLSTWLITAALSTDEDSDDDEIPLSFFKHDDDDNFLLSLSFTFLLFTLEMVSLELTLFKLDAALMFLRDDGDDKFFLGSTPTLLSSVVLLKVRLPAFALESSKDGELSNKADLLNRPLTAAAELPFRGTVKVAPPFSGLEGLL